MVEKRLNSYPEDDPVEPPKGLLAFCLHYSHGAKRWLAAMTVLGASIAALEIMLFGFMGSIVDWLSTADRATFLANEGWKLVGMGVLLLVVIPTLQVIDSLIIHQTLLGNFPQRIRWMAHRYLIRQSMSYFQDEFAGRIGAKLMQTALAVREVVMKVLDVTVYVIVYFTGAVILAFMSDPWLAVPFVVWLVCYMALLRYFIPRLGKVSEQQADARSLMTGRIVDSYTNIATVKLFSHSRREEGYAREAMDGFLGTVYKQMRMVTMLQVSITVMNCTLLFAVFGVGIWQWLGGNMTPGAIAVAAALVLRFQGMSQWVMWEMSALFENIGVVRDGISSISLPRVVADKPGAKPIGEVKGDIRFENISFHYGKNKGVIEGLNLHIRPGEKIGLVGRSGAGKSTIVNLLLRFYDRQEAASSSTGRTLPRSSRTACAPMSASSPRTPRCCIARCARTSSMAGRRHRGDDDRRRRTGRGRRLHPQPHRPQGPQGLRRPCGRAGRQALGRAAPAHRHCPRAAQERAILVLDEATSALDSEVEAAIQSQLVRLMEGKTVIAIAHRLSTIAMMDRLVVLDKGRILEEGTHAQLVDSGGIYSQLWHRQSGGFIDADQTEDAAE